LRCGCEGLRVAPRPAPHAPRQSYLLTSTALATLLQLGAAAALSAGGAGGLAKGGFASGLYNTIFALLPLYLAEIPVTARFTLLRLPLSDRVFTLAPAAHLALSSGWASLVPALAGLAAGLAVSRNLWGLGRLQPAARLATLAQRVGEATEAQRRRAREAAEAGREAAQEAQAAPPRAGGDGGAAAAGGAAAPRPQAAAARPVSEEAVAALEQMGFGPQAVRQALAVSGGDVNAAANLLLSGL